MPLTGDGGTFAHLPPPAQPLPPGVTPEAIAASQAANPNASSGGYEGVGATWTGAQGPSSNDVHSFATMLGIPNLDPAVIKLMNQAWDTALISGGDPGTYAREAFVGSAWFQQAYPYYQKGAQVGLYGSWGEFSKWKNDMNQVSLTMLGRPAYDWELSGWAAAGRTPAWLGSNYTAQANVGSLSDPVKGLFSSDELAQMQAGSITGMQLGQFASWAATAIPLLQQEGLPINRASLEAAYHAGTDPTQYARGQAGISGTFTNASTVLSPAVLSQFTAAEQAEIIQTANGVITPHGAVLMDKAQYFAQIIGYSTTYYGQNNFTREQMEQMYNNGVSPSKIAHDASNAEQAAQQAAAEARQLAREQAAIQKRVDTAKADVAAHAQDYSFALETQGGVGQQGLTAADQDAIAHQMAGEPNPAGAKMQKMIDDAMLRMKANFSGVLANLDRNGYGYALGKPDVGA